MPSDMGKCKFEPGSDGRILDTLTDSRVVFVKKIDSKWKSESLLRHIAKEETFLALIDTGALITGYSNEQVARKLLDFGLSWCDGVLFLDKNDRKKVLVRKTGRIVEEDQCGIPLQRRFVFYDQIHTTGMNIKHAVDATAVITLGKDMVYRDFAQGAYRMRGIGKGQRICVFVTPEIQAEVNRFLDKAGGDSVSVSNIISWLIASTTKQRSISFEKLKRQELLSIWRKRGFEVENINPFVESVSHGVETEHLSFLDVVKAYDLKWSESIKLTTKDCERITNMKTLKETVSLSQFNQEQEREIEQEQMEEAEIEEQVRSDNLRMRRKDRTRVWNFESLKDQRVRLSIMKGFPENIFVTRNWWSNNELIMSSVFTFLLLKDDDEVLVTTLAEAETIRRMIQLGLIDEDNACVKFRTTGNMTLKHKATLKFLHTEMYYDEDEIRVLSKFGDTISRRTCFEYCLKRRPRLDQRVWLDTPVEAVLRFKNDDNNRTTLWLNSLRIKLEGCVYRGPDKMNVTELSRFLGIRDVKDTKRIVKLLRGSSEDVLMTREDICHAFGMLGLEEKELPSDDDDLDGMWRCQMCTLLNRLEDNYCDACQNVRGTKK